MQTIEFEEIVAFNNINDWFPHFDLAFHSQIIANEFSELCIPRDINVIGREVVCEDTNEDNYTNFRFKIIVQPRNEDEIEQSLNFKRRFKGRNRISGLIKCNLIKFTYNIINDNLMYGGDEISETVISLNAYIDKFNYNKFVKYFERISYADRLRAMVQLFNNMYEKSNTLGLYKMRSDYIYDMMYEYLPICFDNFKGNFICLRNIKTNVVEKIYSAEHPVFSKDDLKDDDTYTMITNVSLPDLIEYLRDDMKKHQFNDTIEKFKF